MPRITKPRKKKSSLVLISSLAVLALAGTLYFLLAGGTKSEKAIEPTTSGWEQSSSSLPAAPAPAISVPPPTTVAPPAPQSVMPAEPLPERDPCLEAAGRLDRFFSHLDSRGYVILHQLDNGSEQHFAEMLANLYANPPVVTRETDSLVSILRNTAHFYRVLGKNNIFMIKEILEEESEIIEAAMADFHAWSLLAPDCPAIAHAIRLPLADLYEYAGFFLNSLGGKSYLLRRAPRLRTLTTYYSILILDQANEQGLNRHGIDIRPSLDSLIAEMEAFYHLENREKYLSILHDLKLKYYSRYGG